MFGMFPLIASDVWQQDPVTAGFGLSLFAVIGLPLALVLPRFVANPVQVRTLVMVAGVALVGGYLLMILGSTNLWVLSTALLALGTLCFSLAGTNWPDHSDGWHLIRIERVREWLGLLFFRTWAYRGGRPPCLDWNVVAKSFGYGGHKRQCFSDCLATR